MNVVIADDVWTVAYAQRLFTEQQTNEDMALVDADNQTAAHWFRRWQYLIGCGCPRMTAYDTIAARARKSRKTIQNIVRVFHHFDAGEIETYMQVGITYLTAAVTRKEPERFLDEAMRSPNTNVETLLMEFEADDGEEEERTHPPYRPCLWGAARRIGNIANLIDRAEALGHVLALEDIFNRHGIE